MSFSGICYFVAFLSLYVQYDGLFGVDGLEPARAFKSVWPRSRTVKSAAVPQNDWS